MAGVELFRENYRWQTHETLEAGARGNLLSDSQEARHFINLQVHAETRLGPRTLATAGLNLHHLQYRQGDQQQVTAYHLWVRNLLMTSWATIGATPFRPNRPICCT